MRLPALRRREERPGRELCRESPVVYQVNICSTNFAVAAAMLGKRLTYKLLIADNGLSSGARSC